eukprot:Skav224731  [mRNA]  locus=scaffold699:573890:588190:- [translate_table: standard]
MEGTAIRIVTPVDEVRFWEELKNATGVSDSAVDRATKFSDALSPIASELDEMSKKTFAQLLEFMENVMESVDSLWQAEASPPYPAVRMLHFLKILAGSFGRCVQSRLNSLNVWTSSFSQVSKHIREGYKVCERWNEITLDLTDVQWRSSENIWEGEAFKDDFLTHLGMRIQEVSQLRGQHDQILKLLSAEELRDMQVESCFEPFLKVSAFSYNDYTVPAWRAALSDYEVRMSPIEARVAERLRAELFTSTSNPAQTVRVFQRYQDLLERKNIRQSLTNERERLLTELDDFLGRVQSELETFEVNNLPAGRGLSLPARKMVWVEHFRSKADLAARPLAGFLKDLPSAGKVGNTYRKVRAELKEYRNKAFKDWCDEVDSQLRDPNDPIALEMNSRVMDFDTAQQGALKITYSERLIELVKDARLFEQLGCSIPKEVKMAVQDGMKFYRFAVQLKQAWHGLGSFFRRSLVVISRRSALLRFDCMKKVQWNKLDQLEAFTRHVKDGAERLRDVNRKLRNGHSQVSQEVVQLANISLLRQRDQWKQKISQIQKNIDATIGAVGCQVADAKPWKSHWDYQIFKIMEIQYRFGLESLNENLSEMKADLIVAQKQLKLKPPLEELKASYFKEIKTFIALPLQFKGLDGSPHVYKVMPDRNAEAIAVVFQKADELFVKLQKLQNSYAPWLVVGLLPERVQELVDELSDPKDWDMNFKAIKAKRKEMDKIPDTVKIDCFTISTVILKSVIEDQLDRLSDALIIALKRRASDEAKAVIQFLEEGLEKLNIRPDTVQELGKAQEDAKQLMEQHHEIKKQLDAADEKNKLLKSYAAGIDMNEVQNKWDDFLIKLEAFEQLAHDLREELKGKMDQRILAMNSDIEKFASRWQSLKPKTMENFSMEDAKRNAQQMQEWQTEWQGLKDRDCADFGLAPPELYQIAEVEDDLNKQQASWSLVEEFNQQYEELLSQTWLELRPRLFLVQDLSQSWMTKLREVPRDQVTHMLSQEVQRLAAAHPALRAMTGEPFERDHWKILFGLIKLPPDLRLEELRFKDLAQRLNVIVEKVDELKELTARAIGEVTIRDAVMEVSAWFEQAEFNLMDHQALSSCVKGGFVPLIKDWKDLMSEVSEKQSLCGSLKDSRFFGPFKDQVDKFEEKLALLDELLLCMNKVQRKWVYLEPIFGRGSLPREKERFDKVNNQYRQIMKNVGSQKKVNYLCTVRGLKDQFTNMLDQLERCQKALNSFLEEKRSAFPRLYFIGDEDLLEILGQSSNPEVIQAHLKKLFAGIATVDFDPNITRIVAMNSSLKENVPLGNPVVVKEGEEPLPVEEWLSNLSNEMFSTLAAQLQGCYAQSEMDMQQFERYPSQLLCLSANIHFTFNVERYMSNGQLLQLKDDLRAQLQSMTSLSLEGALPQAKLKSLILDLIHNIAVLDDLLLQKVTRLSDWSWFRQLRYYLKQGVAPEQRPCSVRMLECEQFYSFEYQGNAPKLVHTPLTDKCYLTLMHGLHLGYGGNPYGPAGTGKTESVKALGSCLGRQVLVFNCDEGIDFQAMGRIFVGLVRCGAWGCFDEFNRLLEEQMSAISQSVAMSVPDNELIAEVMMFAEGFASAKVLAQKKLGDMKWLWLWVKQIVSLFLLSRQLLSSQQHYDWGLRALKPILTLAGRLLQEIKAAQSEPLREDEEAAVRMNTLSKLTFADSRRFQDLCMDLFPGINVKDIEYQELEAVIRETIREMRLAEIDSQIYKMLQFHEACQQRMGVGIVGPSGCGKSTIWKVLEAAYKKQGKRYVLHVMNPKSMHRVRLLGHMDHDTREWFDGVLTASARKVIKEPSTTHNWIVCDGDIDPEWVESLNSVLDDNRLLTMPNGERIQFGTNVNFVFETDHLRFASPATISRLTIIFLSEEDVDVKPLVTSWILKQPEDQQDVLQKLRQFCSISTGTTGRIYRPREGRRLVLYLKDINLPTPDKYDTSEIIMFLQQAVMHKGFYDDDLEFVQLEHIQIVASIAPASTLGRHRLATRFTAIVRVCSISYPDWSLYLSWSLVKVYAHFLRAIMTAPHWQNVADRAYAVCDKAAEAMVDVYTNMKARFTMDDHEHYLFNPRDLTQWILQLLRYEVVSIDSFIEAWAYEATRIFRDRLVGDEAKNHFDGILRNALIQYLGTDVDVDRLIFTSMLTLSDEGVPSGDMKKVALEDYTKMVQDGLKSYQREVKDLDIELVPEVLEQIKWMDRALAAPVANDLLVVGRSGGGKRSAISLLAHMHRLAVFSPAPARRYGHKEWKRDLKQVMQMTGVEKQHTILLLEDHHLLKSEFLESINSLLSAGDVPGIWTPEELEPLLAPLKEEWAASQGGGGARTPFEYFCTQVQQRLHVVLSMDPNHSHFLPYCAANPALFSCTTVLWLDEWCDQSKTIIAQRILGEDVLDSKRTNLGPLLQYIHASQAVKGACPRHFITLLQTCHEMYSSKISSASGQSSHLQKGLLKLQEVSQTVEQLQEDAIAKQAVLAEKQQLADQALDRITQAMKKSAERRQEVEQLEGVTQQEQDKTAEEKAQIERELSEIQPILDAAKKAVGSIKPEHLNEIRALKMPPDPIHDVLNGVLRIMGNYDNSWASMKKFLAGTGAIQRIINFDPRSIDDQTRKDVEKLLKEKANSFEHATIYRVSVAAAPLAKWVVASVKYSTVLVKVKPMEEKLNHALESFRAAQEKLSVYKEDRREG